jgi:hypothetical protein
VKIAFYFRIKKLKKYFLDNFFFSLPSSKSFAELNEKQNANGSVEEIVREEKYKRRELLGECW